MKILAASDLHNDQMAARKLAEEAEKENVDMVLILGDVSVFGDLEKGMIRPFVDKKKKVAIITGNHEVPGTMEALVDKYDLIDLEHHSFVYNGIGFFGAGGANIGPNFTSNEDLFDNLKNGFRYVSYAKKKIMVTHVHPDDSMTERFSVPGSSGVRKAINKFKPDVHVCGHVHEMEGFEEKIGNTKVFCVGKRGKIIEI